MARHAALGDEVHVVVVTRGAPELYSEEAVRRIREELREAHALLQVSSTRFLDFPAPQLDTIPKHKLADALRRALYELSAETVYLPHVGDIHHDHREIYHAVLVAARPLPDCPVRKLLCYETLSETEWAPPIANDVFWPNVFVDIAPYLPRKLEAMQCYRSQLKEPPYSRSLLAIESLARLRGMTVGILAAEAFQLVREVNV
jgi:LmbE family N-acetylglucosaminyl deacetylase